MQGWQAGRSDVIRQRNAQAAVKAIGRSLHAVACVLQSAEDAQYMLQEQLARTLQRRLLDVQPLNSTGEMEFFSDGQETT